jgi:orotidine-5'-phosphate decarboxylase
VRVAGKRVEPAPVIRPARASYPTHWQGFRLAVAAGADGLVCSPREVAPLRAALGEGPALVVPGVRPAGSAADDQARTATPEEMAAAGADFVVVGRPITKAADPAAAAAAIARALRA